jgi:sarcosine oxidase, subunit beta
MTALPVRTADVVVVGAGVQGASTAYQLAQRGVRVVVVERASVGAGATGRSSGFVRMHYDLALEARLAWVSFPYFLEWADRVGEGDPGFVRTGFLQLVPPQYSAALRANVAAHQGIGIPAELLGPDDVARVVPGMVVDDVEVAAWEPFAGYADPTGTAAGLLAAARRAGASVVTGVRVAGIRVEGDRVLGVDTDAGAVDAPVVVVAAGAWSAEVARTAGVEIPVQAWRHDTAYFGLPASRPPGIPIVLDHGGAVYFRPEGADLMLVGLETGNEMGGSPDRPLEGYDPGILEPMIERLCRRVPWMADGDFRTAHGGQDGMTPDQRPILGPVGQAGPDGLFLQCGFSGTGFKTAPAIGACMAEWILDGRPLTVDVTPFRLERFAEGRLIEGEHPYESLWR